MSEFEAMVQHHVGAAQRKRALQAAQAEEKRNLLDPVFDFGVDEVEVLDQDTVRLPNGEVLRLSAGQGRTLDAYEADSPGIPGAQKYAERPETFEAHRRNYARAYGLDPDDVTVDDLVNAGNSQKAKAPERLKSMADENGRIRYRRRGNDDYGRTVAELDPGQVDLSGRQDNAAYYSRFNYAKGLEDLDSGAVADQLRGAGGRTFKEGASDQVVNFAVGAGRMANDLVQGAGALVGLNNIPGIDEGHRAVRDALESFKEWGNSPEQLRRERLEQERNELQSEFFNTQKEKYIRDGNSELSAGIRAGIDEFTNSIGNIIDNPGSILDKTVESLPYMLGVASAGRAATTRAIKGLQKNILKDPLVGKLVSKSTKGRFQTKAGYEKLAAHHTEAFLRTKKGQAYLKRVQTITGVTTVGLTEGLSTAADVYDSVANMTEEQAANSEKYLALRAQGLSHEKATEELAEDAHLQTLLTVTLAAGAASFVTGAAPFEAQLFTGLRKVSSTTAKAAAAAKKTAAEVAKKKGAEKAKGVVRGTASLGWKATKGTAKVLGKHVAPGALKEGAEELLQSGGGEFLSQLAKFDATGEPIGPGVGRAAGEGAVVGLASGGFAELTFNAARKAMAAGKKPVDVKKLLSQVKEYGEAKKATITRASDFVDAAATGQPVNIPEAPDAVDEDEGGGPAPAGPAPTGGSNTPNPPETEEIDPDPGASFDKTLKEVHPSPVHLFVALDKIRTRAGATGKPLSEQQEEYYDIVRQQAHEMFMAKNDAVNAKKPEDVTDRDVFGLVFAATFGFEPDTSNLSDAARAQVEETVRAQQNVKLAEEVLAEKLERAPTEAAKKTVRQVHDAKFGDRFDENGRHGLGYYNRRMRELMAQTDPSDNNGELATLAEGLKRFNQSQNAYLDAARQALLEQGKNGPVHIKGGRGKPIEFQPNTPENRGGTQGLVDMLEKEDAAFKQIVDSLRARHQEWRKAAKVEPTNASQQQAEAAEADTGAPKKKGQKQSGKQETARDRAYKKAVAKKAELLKQLQSPRTDEEKKAIYAELKRQQALLDAIERSRKAAKADKRDNKSRKADANINQAEAAKIAKDFTAVTNNEDLTTAEKRKEIGALIKRAAAANALGLIRVMRKLNDKLLAQEKAARIRKAQETKFDDFNLEQLDKIAETISSRTDKLEEVPVEDVDPYDLPMSAVEKLTTGTTQLGETSPAIMAAVSKYLQKFVELSKRKGKGVLTQAIRQWKELDKHWLRGDTHKLIYRYGWVPPTKGMVRDLSRHIGDRPVIMPAAGLGFMAHILKLYGHDVSASDQFVAPHVWTDVKKQDAVEAARNAPANSVLFITYPEMRGENFMADVIDAFNGEEIIYQGIRDDGFGEGALTLNPAAMRKLNEMLPIEITDQVPDHSDSLYVETIAFAVNVPALEQAHFRLREDNPYVIKLEEELGFTGAFDPNANSELEGLLDEEEGLEETGAPVTFAQALEAAQAQGQGAQAILQHIAANGSPENQVMAKRLLELLGDRPIRIINAPQDQFKAATGHVARGAFVRYKRGDKEGYIILNKDKLKDPQAAENTIVHEAIHAALNGAIAKGLSPELTERLLKLRMQVSQALMVSDDPLADTMLKIISKDPEELLTHGLATPWMQNFLKNTKVQEKTLFQGFVDLLARILGFKNTSALAAVIDITNQIFEETSPKSKKVEAEANNEGAGAAPRAANATESVAEGVNEIPEDVLGEEGETETPQEALQRKRAEQAKASRLSRAKRLRTLVEANPKLHRSQLYLYDPTDQAMLKRLLSEGVEPVAALNQVIAAIEPNPSAREVKSEPSVPLEAREQAAKNGAQLNLRENKKPVKARKLPETLRNMTDAVAGAAAGLKKSLSQYRLGETLTDMFDRRSGNTMDLLVSDPMIMRILIDDASREEFFEAIGTTPDEERALIAFADFATAFGKALQGKMRKLPQSSQSIVKVLDKSPHYYWQDENGRLDANVVGAMALEAMQYLVGTGAQSTWNSPESIRSILGLEENEAITGEMLTAVGRGRSRTQVVQEIGTNVLRHLNIKAKDNARKQITEQMISAIGAQVLTTLKSMTVEAFNEDGKLTQVPYIYQHGVSRNLWNRIATQEISESTSSEAGPVMMVSNNFGQVWDVNKGDYVRKDVTADLRDAITEGRGIFTKLFGSNGSVRAPQFNEPTLEDIPTKVGRSTGLVPDEMRERQLHDAKNGFRVESKIVDLIERFESPEEYLTLAHDYQTDEQLDALHDTLRPGAQGRNDGLLRDLTEMLSWNRQYGRRRFFLTSRQTRSGRFIYDSNVINPQSNKIHRFGFIRDGWTRHIDKKNPSKMTKAQRKMYEKLMMAIGLGMGLKTEYTAIADVVHQVESAFSDPNSDWHKAMQAVVSGTEKFTAEEKAAIQAVLKKSGEGTHTMAALNAAAAYFTAEEGSSVEISLPHETDGVTNGYIIGLLETPPAGGMTEAYKQLLNAGGIYFDGDPWKNLMEYKAAGNLDNYEYIANDSRVQLKRIWEEARAVDDKALAAAAKATGEEIGKRFSARNVHIQRGMKRIVDSGLVPHPHELNQETKNGEYDQGVGRKWAKNPLMVMSYGAGELSIARQVLAQAQEKFYELLAESTKDLDDDIAQATSPEDKVVLEQMRAERVAAALNRAYRIINMVVEANQKAGLQKKIGTDPQTGQDIYEPYKYMGSYSGASFVTAQDVIRLAKDQYGGDITALSRGFTLSDDALALFNMAIKLTYADALTAALNKRLKPVKMIRARMNAMNQVVNELYVRYYKKLVAEREANGEILNARDKLEIQEDLARQGLMPAIRTAEALGGADSLPMTESISEYLKSGSQLLQGVGWIQDPIQLVDIIHGLNGQTQIPDPSYTITGRMQTRVPDANVGVAAVVKSIHALDGVINSLLWGRGKYSVINVHDAQVSPWWAADDVAMEANSAFAETLSTYDLPQEFMSMAWPIIHSLYSSKDGRLSQEDKDATALALYTLAQEHTFLENADTPPGTVGGVAIGHWMLQQLGLQVIADQKGSQETKTDIFKKVRWVNQFAQEGTQAHYPNGFEIGLRDYVPPNALPAPDGAITDQSAARAVEGELLPRDNEVDLDIKFEEEFIYQLESEKVVTTWEGIANYETSDISTSHQNHLRNIVKNLVAPALQTIESIFEEVSGPDASGRQSVTWDGNVLRMRAAGNVLTSNNEVTLQERAAQEYVYHIVDHGVQKDHFVRKELRRLYELAEANLSPSSFLPETVTGDPDVAYELAEARYNYIFDSTNIDEAYKRFLSIGLTNEPFLKALSNIDNTSPEPSFAPNWDKGILRGMMSLFRQLLEKVSGQGLTYQGGKVSDAMVALAQATVATNVANMKRLKDLQTGADNTSRVQRFNAALLDAVNDRFVEPLKQGLEATSAKRLDPENPTLPGFLKAATYVAFQSRDTELRNEYNRFYRELTTPYGIGKDNAFFQTIAEVTPWKEENLNWIGLLRKSKYIVDMARQEVNDHTRSYINDSFDKKNYMSKAHKMAMSNTLLKTDLSVLLDDESGVTDLARLAEILRDRNVRDAEKARLEAALRGLLAKEGVNPNLYFGFQNQARSLASIQARGIPLVENPMLNAHNIAMQRMYYSSERTALKEVEKATNLIDRLATLYALDLQATEDMRLTNEIVQHEMNRTDVGDDNGFSRLMGMHINFKMLAKQNLFKGNPTQMIKGYVYEIFDGDVNVEYVKEGSERHAEVIAEGMQLVGELPKDAYDDFPEKRLLYKGLQGLSTYNKSVVSLTDLQHRGANLFSTAGYQSEASRERMRELRRNAFLGARNQRREGYLKAGANVVPVFNEAGDIVDYRYIMSEKNKREILKKEDPFDRVLPRMFASITDRNNSREINKDVVTLLKQEWTAGQADPGQRFIRIGLYPDPSATPAQQERARQMWHLIPEEMQKEAKRQFGFDGFYVRDEVTNLVLGFRKATVSNIKGKDGRGTLWGKGTPVVRMAEKVWLEVVSLMRIKIAILTPAVVVGNIASNTAMLLGEGIPLNYIRKNAAEAISSMRQYQKDRQKATELERHIGSQAALGKDTRRLEVQLARLYSNMNANPVADLVRDGLFTSITADLGVDDDTIRGSLIQKAEDLIGKAGGKTGKAAGAIAKEAYMLPGSKGYKAAVAATQYGDFVARYIKFKYDTQVNKKDREAAINEALASFIYYDIPQPKYLQALNDSGLVMFTKFFLRIQHIVARMYGQNPASAFAVLGIQKAMLPDPFDENIANYAALDGLENKGNNPLNLPFKAWDTLNPTEPALLQWILNPFGL